MFYQLWFLHNVLVVHNTYYHMKKKLLRLPREEKKDIWKGIPHYKLVGKRIGYLRSENVSRSIFMS